MATTSYQPSGAFPLGFSCGGNEASSFDGDNVDVSANDAVFSPRMPRAFYVGVAGDVQVTSAYGNAVLFKAVPAGQIIPFVVQGISHTGTTATSITVMY